MAKREGNYKRHPDAIAWDQWVVSPEGKDMTNGSASGQYLQNRLARAFRAGADAARQSASKALVQLFESPQ